MNFAMGTVNGSDEPSLSPELVAQQARLFAEAGIPVNCCPLPDPAAADRWRRAWHLRDMELQAELTT